MITIQESFGKKYKVSSGTFYHIDTPDHIVEKLEQIRLSGQRIVLDYGDIKTGRSWGETNDIAGTIGRSTGQIKVPILIHNKKSMGGGSILTHCIIGIKTSLGKIKIL